MATVLDVALWQRFVDFLSASDRTAEPWGQDRARVRCLLAEMYLVGERPPTDTVDAYLTSKGIQHPSRFRSSVLDLWAERVREPRRALRGRYQWAYPFVLAETLTGRDGLEPIGPRLLRQLATAAGVYLKEAERHPGSDAADRALEDLRIASHCAIVWGLTRDRDPNADWIGPGLFPRRRAHAELTNPSTRRGRRLLEDRRGQAQARLGDPGR